jgi:DNA-binding NarL/FixJ family response regulator
MTMKNMNTPKHITVLLAEDHTVVREGLRTLLEAEGDIQVVGEAATGREAVELARKLRPAVVVMDIAMPVLNGLEATRQIRKTLPDAKVLILSAHSDDAYVEQVMALGAAGYLLKQTSAHVLSKAVREVQKGNTFFSPSIARSAHTPNGQSPVHGQLTRQKGPCLSSREVEVLQLIAEGKANKQVAAELGISVKTVEKHRQRLMEKLNIHDTAGLTRYAIAAGIIESSVQVRIV